MVFVGVDLHKHTITLAVFDAARKRLARKRYSNLQSEAIVAFLKTLGPFQLVVEATASYEWFVQLVEPHAKRVVLAHPGKLRVIAESTRKSDNLDAQVLAEMLALDQIPESYRRGGPDGGVAQTAGWHCRRGGTVGEGPTSE